MSLKDKRRFMKRREFLQFLGLATVGGQLINLSSCSSTTPATLKSLPVSYQDKLEFLPGLDFQFLIKEREKITPSLEFGFNNDYIAFLPLEKDRAILWVNHEYVDPYMIKGWERTKENIETEMTLVGGSLLELKRNDGQWNVVKNSPLNRRLDAFTPIPFAWPHKIKNSSIAIGTMANCAGSITPWGTVLTCEENYDNFWGDRNFAGETIEKSWVKWEKFYNHPPEHYGWVVEVNPHTGKAKKLVSLGRIAHECAATIISKKGHAVSYTGDDKKDEHLYKFISKSKDSLVEGELFVADITNGKWLSLDIEKQPILKKHFKNQTNVQTYVREAAKMLGATPLARPEDIEFDPISGNIFVALTNNKDRKNFHGSILKITEDNGDYESLTFKSEEFLIGGSQTGFSSPDNMVFDKVGNLWFTTDIAGWDKNRPEYKDFGNNSLFVFLRNSGEIIRVANAPVDAEITGPMFDADYSTLFLSIQHPGETSTTENKFTSNWPTGGQPQNAVVTVTGPLLEKIVNGKL